MRSAKKFIVVGLTGVFGLFLVFASIAVVMAPSASRAVVEGRLERIEQRTGLKATFERLDILGVSEVEIKGLTVKDGDEILVSVGHVVAQLNPIAILSGERRARHIEVSDVIVRVAIDADGNIPLLDKIRAPKADSLSNDAEPAGRGLTGKLDVVPEATFSNVRIVFEVAQGGPTLPVSEISAESARWSWDGEKLSTSASVGLIAGTDPRMQVPKSIDVSMNFDNQLRPVSGDLKLDGVFAIAGIDPLRFLKAEVGGVGIDDNGSPFISDVKVSTTNDVPVFETKSIQFALGSLSELRDFKFGSITLTDPTLMVSFDKRGASIVGDLDAVLRGAAAKHVVVQAKSVASAVAERRDQPAALPLNDDEEAEGTSREVDEPTPDLDGKLQAYIDRIPGRITIRNAAIKVTDERQLNVTRPAKNLMMRNGEFSIGVDKDTGIVAVSGGFEATGEAAPRGTTHMDLRFKPAQRTMTGSVDVDALDLSWVSQLLGRRMSDTVRGGTLRAKISFQEMGPSAFDFEGLVGVENLTFFDARLAEEPLTNVTASYSFNATYDGNMKMPPPQLLKTDIYKGDPEHPEKAPPVPKGSLVFRKGAAQIGDVKLTFRPSVYGFNAPGRIPARLDVVIDLPRTPVMSLLKAVPSALMGSTAGTQMEGFFEWKFHVEVPMYRAADMEWKTNPKLSEFQVINIPYDVDVRRLMDGMSVTIVDSIEEENDFTRTIKLKPARPVPVEWMLENTGLTLEEIDARRRKREWPQLPTRFDGVSDDIVDSPEVWKTQWANRQQAAKPWDEFSTVEARPDMPYGPYVFVPIQYISPYLIRAVMTTEDTSFFHHDGFNMLALKESIERNLNSGQFKRGASTIAMQMIKNVFLNRKKVISRKLQEAFLVFLMESAVDIPKVRIMEVYLNVIEFGPGIFGINEGALHYFGKHPDDLTLGEVAWLVSIIPGPKKFHTYYQRGAITPAYFNRMKRYIQAMFNRGRITQEELDQAMIAPPEFYKPGPNEPLLKPKQPRPFIPLFDEEPSPPPMLLAPVDL